MLDLPLISTSLLWCVVVAQGLMLIGTMRNLGRLSLQVGPDRPLDRPSEIRIGVRFAPDWLPTPGVSDRLVLFVSPSCGICRSVLSGLKDLMAPAVDLVIVCQSDPEEAHRYLGQFGLERIPVVADVDGAISGDAGVHEIPFAILLATNGSVQRTAIVNSPRQVEAMLEAARRKAA